MHGSKVKGELVHKAAPTQGDASEAAAGGGTAQVNARMIPFVTPGGESRQQEGHSSIQFSGATFLEPPEDPAAMYKMLQLSAYLTPVMDALETNVYKAPFVLRSVIPFDRPDEAYKIVHDMLLWEKAKGNNGTFSFDADVKVTEREVADALEKLQRRSVIEKHYLDRFFQEAIPDMTYRQLGALTGQDYEVTGNAYWEVVRDTAGNIARFQWLPSISMRATRQDREQIATAKLVKDGLHWVKTPQIRRFRRYAQLQSGGDSANIASWFKELGDPRAMSRKTGKFYSTKEAMQLDEGDERQPNVPVLPATEVLHFKLLFGGSSVYGKPRWSGAYISLCGSRDLDEENQKIVGDEAVPSLMLLISGGVVGTKSYDRIKTELEERKKGRKGIMVIEAVASGKGPVTPSQQPSIEVERLKSEQTSDMLYQKYDGRNEDKAGGAWRFPKTVLGKAGANRATSQSERQFAEDQIFAPLRVDKDEPINTNILADIGITTWVYETQSMQPRDPQQRAEILRILVEAGILTPNEGRELAAPIFAKRLDDLQGLWTQFPPRVLTVLLQTKNGELASTLLGQDKEALAKLANTVRNTLGLNPGGSAAQNIPDVEIDKEKVKDAKNTSSTNTGGA